MKSKFILPAILILCLLASCSLDFSQVQAPPSGSATDTLAVTLTPSDTPPPTSTFTPEVVTMSVSVDTNCRTGPGEVYDWVGGLMTGQVVQVLATDPTGRYYYIENPSGPGYCWVWAEYATVVGNKALLAVYTPLPTPTPVIDFTVSIVELEWCISGYARINLENIGALTWESYRTVATDLTNSSIPPYWNEYNTFTDGSGCLDTTSVPNIPPGDNAIVYAGYWAMAQTGHNIRVDITLCSQDGMLGTCVTHTINVVP